ncbi:MAG: hypothetical protein JO340_12685 [Acidobacteriaceae bacterium]|nr:hypothetical protein [Acidobacteriaceae bacterium]
MQRAQPPLVKGHPYVASYRTGSPSLPGGSVTGRVYRDSAGRSRLDIDSGTGQEVQFIDDPATGTFFVIDSSNKSYERDSHEPIDIGWIFPNAAPIFTEEHLVILGLDCVRVRLRAPRGAPEPGDVGEAWVSKQYGILMKQRSSQDWNWEITEIQFREPGPGTFDVPAGYRESR